MSQNVMLVPGLLGSQIGVRRFHPFADRVVWLNLPLLAAGAMADLDLDADGAGPGQQARSGPQDVLGPLIPCYGPAVAFMLNLGWRARIVGYDWRLSLSTNAPLLVQACLDAFGDEPFALVGHSMGGLLARAAWKLMQAAGRGDQVQRIVTVGTPHYGAWEIVRLWFRLPPLFQGLALATGLVLGSGHEAAAVTLDGVVASWPGLYDLMPFRSYGPLHDHDPLIAGVIYDVDTYRAYNTEVSAANLSRAVLVQDQLQSAIPPGRLVSILGTGLKTPYLMAPSGELQTDDGYLFTDAGDGETAVVYGTLPGVPRAFVYGPHGELLLLPSVLGLLSYIVPNGLAADFGP